MHYYDFGVESKVIELAERYPQIYASVGIHPNPASQEREDFPCELAEMVKHPKVVAVGETGLQPDDVWSRFLHHHRRRDRR